MSIKAGDTVKIGGDASEKYIGRRAHVLKLLPAGTLAECRVPGVELRPGDAYPAFPVEWLVPVPAVEPLVIETPTIVIMAVAQLQQERDELAAKLKAAEAANERNKQTGAEALDSLGSLLDALGLPRGQTMADVLRCAEWMRKAANDRSSLELVATMNTERADKAERRLEELRMAMCDKHKHTDECLKYASETRQPYCIAQCAESRCVLTSLVES